MREPVYKRYAKLLKLVALANGEPDGLRDAIMPVGDTIVNYGPKEKFAPLISQTLRKLAAKPVPKMGEVQVAVPLPDLSPVGIFVDFNSTMRETKDFNRDVFLPALKGGDVRRIKVCPICDKLFVALRLDQPACSRKCGNAHRARKFRRKYESNRRRYRKLGIRAKELIKLNASLRLTEKPRKPGRKQKRGKEHG